MPHFSVTADAGGGSAIRGMAIAEHGTDQLAMTVDTGILNHHRVFWTNDEWVVVVLQREGLGVPETVLSLDQVLGQCLVRNVAIPLRSGSASRPDDLRKNG